MLPVEAILIEPVGCLAEFPAEPFLEIAARVFNRKRKLSRSGSRSYWHLLNLIGAADRKFTESENHLIELLELQAVNAATVYEDVLPALSELQATGVAMFIASSLSSAAITRFLARSSTAGFFSAVSTRDTAGGVRAEPLRCLLPAIPAPPNQTIFLTDTAEGLKAAKCVGLNPILMMNDPDEAQRLALQDPAGGIVSLHELPDLIRLVAEQNARLPHP